MREEFNTVFDRNDCRGFKGRRGVPRLYGKRENGSGH
jgi:hypothetical protein